MAFLAPAAAAAGTAGAVGAGAAGLGAATAGTAAAATGAGALGTGLAAGAATAGGIFGGAGLGTLGALGGLAPTAAGAAGGAGLGGLGAAGLGAAKTAGSTVALEGAKNAIISNAMQQQAMQNAIMQNVAGGIASPASQLATSASMGLSPGQQAFLNASTAGPGAPIQALGPKITIPPNSVGSGWGSYTMDGMNRVNFLANQPPVSAPTVTPAVTPQVAPTATDVAGGFRGIDPTRISSPGLKLDPTATVDPTTVMGRGIRPEQNFLQNLGNIGSFQDVKDYAQQHPYATSAMAGLGLQQLMKQKSVKAPEESPGLIRPYTFSYNAQPGAYDVSPTADSSERLYFNPIFTAQEPYEAPGPEYKASGGLAAAYAVGGPVEQMAAMNSVGMNTGYPMADINTPVYANPMMQRPEATNVIAPSADAGVGAYSGEPRFADGGETKTEGTYKYSYDPKTMQFTQLSVPTIRQPVINAMTGSHTGAYTTSDIPVKNSGSKISGGMVTPAMGPMQTQPTAPIDIPAYQTPEQRLGLGSFYDYMNQQLAGYGGYSGYAAGGGVSHLGDYSDGGRLLKGPGDGVSDSIPASIGGRQPARLADGEFVVPARIVSEIGNGSTEAGARKLYAMMDRVQNARRKTTGKNKVAKDTKADKYLPA